MENVSVVVLVLAACGLSAAVGLAIGAALGWSWAIRRLMDGVDQAPSVAFYVNVETAEVHQGEPPAADGDQDDPPPWGDRFSGEN